MIFSRFFPVLNHGSPVMRRTIRIRKKGRAFSAAAAFRGLRAQANCQLFSLLFALIACSLPGLTDGAAAQESSGLQVAATVEKALVDAIARTEKSVVAIARVRKDLPGEAIRFEFRPDAFGRRSIPTVPTQPTDRNFVPNEYGTGVVVDARGLILTAYHVLGEDSDYFVTASDRKLYRAWIKAADPRSDLAVLGIDVASAASGDLPAIAFGDATTLRKGQIVLTLGNPMRLLVTGKRAPAGESWPTWPARRRPRPRTPIPQAAGPCTISAR